MNPLKIEIALQASFIKKKQTLALAESCTGGLIASALTQIPGSSAYFLGSIVVYDNSLKTNILNVNVETLKKYGAVSKEAAEEMVLGLFKIVPCDYGLAVTGIAGPTGGSPEKPVGTVWGAIAKRGGEVHTYLLQLKGSREEIREHAKDQLLKKLLEVCNS